MSSMHDDPVAAALVDPYSDLELPLNEVRSHRFVTYEEMKQYVSAIAAANNFMIRAPKNKGTTDTVGHSGSFRCWCYRKPPNRNDRLPTATSLTARVPQALLINRHGQQPVRCHWHLRFGRCNTAIASPDYYFTSRLLTHNGHSPTTEQKINVKINSERNMTDKMKRAKSNLIDDGVLLERIIKRVIERRFKIKFNNTLFHTVVTRIKSELFPYNGNDMQQLFTWFLEQKNEQHAIAEFDLDDENCVRRVLYMSAGNVILRILFIRLKLLMNQCHVHAIIHQNIYFHVDTY